MTLGQPKKYFHGNKNIIYKEKIDQLDFVETENFCSVKNTVKIMKKVTELGKNL